MKYTEKEYERYLQERNALEEARYKTSENYDKALLTLAGGALAISMTFITDIAKTPVSKGYLITAWLFFGMSIVFHLVNHRLCIQAHDKTIEELDKELEANFTGEKYTGKRNGWAVVTEVFNYINLSLFLIGIVFLGVFVFLNM